ncbi:MAG TPA: carboxypeptidase-like regulatory domain-containing protein [Mycobacteriales bacterium]|nr:carboxypeptidase-like regulatory domain-containing protein [Mycobacteriales bacterium]
MRLSSVLVAGFALVAAAACGPAGAQPRGPAPVSGASASTAPPTWGTVSGLVTDGAGRPASGVLIVPAAADPDTPAVPELAVLTDSAGRYTWRLSPGRYTLAPHQGNRPYTAKAVTVTPRAQLEVNLSLT